MEDEDEQVKEIVVEDIDELPIDELDSDAEVIVSRDMPERKTRGARNAPVLQEDEEFYNQEVGPFMLFHGEISFRQTLVLGRRWRR